MRGSCVVFWRYAMIAVAALALAGSSGLGQEEGNSTFGGSPNPGSIGSAPKNKVVAAYGSPDPGKPGPGHKVIAQAGLLDPDAAGITVWHDYGSFKLYRVSETALHGLEEEVRRQIVLFDGKTACSSTAPTPPTSIRRPARSTTRSGPDPRCTWCSSSARSRTSGCKVSRRPARP